MQSWRIKSTEMRAPTQPDNLCSDGLLISEREDFSDYLWMEDVESFDKQVLAELQEEEEMEQCMEEMLAEEEARDTTYYIVDEQSSIVIPCPVFPGIIQDEIGVLQSMATLGFYDSEIVFIESQLNPDAEEFVPSSMSTASSTATSQSSAPGETPDR